MHAFGFELHPNTPWMSSRNGLFFDNYISASGSTTLSLTNALAVREGNVTNLSDNLVALANKAGFHTYWISNQHMKGIYDSPVGVMGKKAGFIIFSPRTVQIKEGRMKCCCRSSAMRWQRRTVKTDCGAFNRLSSATLRKTD